RVVMAGFEWRLRAFGTVKDDTGGVGGARRVGAGGRGWGGRSRGVRDGLGVIDVGGGGEGIKDAPSFAPPHTPRPLRGRRRRRSRGRRRRRRGTWTCRGARPGECQHRNQRGNQNYGNATETHSAALRFRLRRWSDSLQEPQPQHGIGNDRGGDRYPRLRW